MMRQVSFVAVAALLLAACATPRSTERVDTVEDPLPTPADVDLSEYEEFDIAPYVDEQPVEETIDHDVPATLMEGSAASGVARNVQGFRIQVLSSVEKDEAVALEEEAKQWWRTEGRSESGSLFGSDLPVYVVYRQPYYRVRLGNFTSRDQANRALSVVEGRFPGSFIVPDVVTVIED